MRALLGWGVEHPVVWTLITPAAMLVLAFVVELLARATGRWLGARPAHALWRAALSVPVLLALAPSGWLAAPQTGAESGWRAWLWVLPALLWEPITATWAMTGSLRYALPAPRQAAGIALNMLTVGLFEEALCRGLALYVLAQAWGPAAGLLLSSLLFGATHLIHLAFGKPARETVTMTLSAFVGGLGYGAFVLATGSVWPAVLLHGAANAAANVKIATIPDYREPRWGSVWHALLSLPVAAYALALLYAAAQ